MSKVSWELPGRVTRVETRDPESSTQLGRQQRVLVVDHSRFSANTVRRALAEECQRGTVIATTLAEARQILATQAGSLMAAVVGLELPDASGAEIVELTLEHHLPTIVLTASWDEDTRARIWKHDVFDYYLKDENGLRAACRAIQRIPRNPSIKVLVVDGFPADRALEAKLLQTQGFQVLVANDGTEALAALEAHPDISLVLVDEGVPNLNGVELVSRIRRIAPREEVAVMGVATSRSVSTSVGFLKHGANDFLRKPFEKEEFYCRVYTCVETVESLRALQHAAFTDGLTGLRNRFYFFRQAPALFARVAAEGGGLVVAMIDIDFFKRVNDTYGHAAGDAVLRSVAQIAMRTLEKLGLVARFGGEEFCFFSPSLSREAAEAAFEGLRAQVEASVVTFGEREIRVTISIGVALSAADTLDATLGRADAMLYQAKQTGRNRVVIEGPT